MLQIFQTSRKTKTKLFIVDPNCKEFGIIIMHLPLPVKSVLKTECPYSTVKIEIVSTVTIRVEHYLHLGLHRKSNGP